MPNDDTVIGPPANFEDDFPTAPTSPPPSRPDDRPTDPAPPPESTLPPGVNPDHLLDEMRKAARDDERWQGAAQDFTIGPSIRCPLAGADPDAPCSTLTVTAVDRAAGVITLSAAPEPARPGVTSLGVAPDGSVVPVAPNPARHWHDWGLDTGPRLRVKGLVDPPKPEPMEDHDGWRERHARLERAKAEGDDHTVGKMLPQYLDELHSEAPKPPIPPLDWGELEPAMVAELREWGRAHGVRSGQIGLQRLFDGSVEVVLGMRDGAFRVTFDARAMKAAWRSADGKPRGAASVLGLRLSDELAAAKRWEIICVPDPLLGT